MRVPKRGVLRLQGDELLVEVTFGVVLPYDRVLLEYLQALAVAGFLSVVDERHAFAYARKHDSGIEAGAELLELGAVPRVLVVVTDEGHAHDVVWVIAFIPGVVIAQAAEVVLAPGGELAHSVVPGPGVSHVEGVLVQIARLPLGEHEDGLDSFELLACVVPEVDGDVAGDVAAVAVNVGLADPIRQ